MRGSIEWLMALATPAPPVLARVATFVESTPSGVGDLYELDPPAPDSYGQTTRWAVVSGRHFYPCDRHGGNRELAPHPYDLGDAGLEHDSEDLLARAGYRVVRP